MVAVCVEFSVHCPRVGLLAGWQAVQNSRIENPGQGCTGLLDAVPSAGHCAVMLVSLGVCLVLAGNIILCSYHAYQAELFPTGIRARTVWFVYSGSWISAMLSAFVIAGCLSRFGVNGVFVVISGAMATVAIGLFRPKTRDVAFALDDISR